MNKAQLLAKIDRNRQWLKDTRSALAHDRSATKDVLVIVIPMLEDQLELMENILNYVDISNV